MFFIKIANSALQFGKNIYICLV